MKTFLIELELDKGETYKSKELYTHQESIVAASVAATQFVARSSTAWQIKAVREVGEAL